VIEAAILAEEFGRMLHPGPFLPVNVVADAVSRTGSDKQKESILPELAAGTTIASWAIADGPGCWDARELRISATRDGDAYLVRGSKRWVQDALAADLLLVSCRYDGGVVQLLVPSDSPGIRLTSLTTADIGRRFADVHFQDVYVPPDSVLGEPAAVDAQLARQLQIAVVLQCAESVGAATQILARTVAYAKDRTAFGRPIGSFQAVKHLLAETATRLEAAEATTWAAVRALAEDRDDLARDVHVAKAFVSRHCPHIVEACMQVHAGIAMTWEHDAHLYLRRVKSNSLVFGTARWHADRLCDVIGVAA
jgi:alkylation response protein AidB-like acyl-CoA dehydrogenase